MVSVLLANAGKHLCNVNFYNPNIHNLVLV